MKTIYEFSVDDRDNIICKKIINNKKIKYSNNNAIKVLINRDNIKYKIAKINNRQIKLINGNEVVYIKNLEKLADDGIFDLIPHITNKIKKAIVAKNKKINEIKKGFGSKVVAGGILVFTLLATTAGIKKISSNNETLIPEDTIEYDSEIEIDVEEKILIESDEDVQTNEQENNDELIEIVSNDDLIGELNDDESEYMDTNVQKVYYNMENNPDLEKYENASKYTDTINTYCQKWGISSNLVMCLLSQESGGYEQNLMQITFDSWKDMPITQYDFNKGIYQTIILTDTPNKYSNFGYTCISRDELLNEKTNISVACCLLRESIDYMNGHIVAGIQCYNYGIGAMNTVLNETSKNTGLSIDEILSDQQNTSFLEYTDILKDYGDSKYFEHIMNYNIDDDNKVFTIMHYNKDTNSCDETKILVSAKNNLRKS